MLGKIAICFLCLLIIPIQLLAAEPKVGDVYIVSVEIPVLFVGGETDTNDGGTKFFIGDLCYPVGGGTITVLKYEEGMLVCQLKYVDKHGGMSAPNNSFLFMNENIVNLQQRFSEKQEKSGFFDLKKQFEKFSKKHNFSFPE